MRVSFFVLAPDTGREPAPYGLGVIVTRLRDVA